MATLGAAVLALAGLAACGSSSTHHGIPADGVAAVNGTPITNAAVLHWLAVAAITNSTGPFRRGAVAPDPPLYTACVKHLEEVNAIAGKGHHASAANLKRACEYQFSTLQKRAVSYLLASQWVIAEAQREGIDVSDAEVRQQLEKVKREKFHNTGGFEKYLAETGQTVSDVLFQLKLSMLDERITKKLISSVGSVSDSEIEHTYDTHKSEFAPYESRDARVLQTKTEDEAKSAKQEIQSGKSFASVAKAKSTEAATAANGGLVAPMEKEQFVLPLEEAINAAPEGVLKGPLKTLIGYYIYEVVKINHNPAKSLAQARASIKASLSSLKERELLQKYEAEFKKRWQALTECRPGYVVEQCVEYKPTSTASTSTTPAP